MDKVENFLDQDCSGFHKLSRQDRVKRLMDSGYLNEEEMSLLLGHKKLDFELAENLIENVIGYFPMPFGVATNFVIDGVKRFIPMVVEETSIIAAASATAKWVCQNGVIHTHAKGKTVIGQIEFPLLQNENTMQILQSKREELIQLANAYVPGLVSRGAGVRDIAIRKLEKENGLSLVLHVLMDPGDAMGANLINQVCEALKPKIEKWTDEKIGLCILSNLVDTRLACAEVILRNVDPELAEGIEKAWEFADLDPYRATTHNKGVLNGIDPILIATGNDWRAFEAGAHAYVARNGTYKPLTVWKRKGHELHGSIELPGAVGVVGGMTKIHPLSQMSLKLLKVERSEDLARLLAAVGLVQNLGALKALSTVGIVKGHMKLHAANLAMAAGAEFHEIAAVRERLAQVLRTEKSINLSHAKKALTELRIKTNHSVR